MEAFIVAVLGVIGLIIAALIAGGVTLAVAVIKWQADNQRLWHWNRQLVDHIYRGLGPPPPPPPKELFD